jgi:hypothetical protein
MTSEFEFGAPWSASLKAVSATAVLLAGGGMPLAAALAEHSQRGVIGARVAALLAAATLVVGALFVVRGYGLWARELHVHRLFWDTVVPLERVRAVYADPEAMGGSLRLFGNGGLFSITGLYRNARLGDYRVYGTDPARAVVLEVAGGTLVVTPDDPHRFVVQLLRLVDGGARR